MTTAVPQPVDRILNEYISLVRASLPDMLVGLYLHGSLALDAFSLGLSDIDFIAVVSRRCTISDMTSLQAVHQQLAQRYPDVPLAGSYLQSHDLGQDEATMLPHPYVHNGIFQPSGYHDINAVTWWLLQQRGIAVIGPPVAHFNIRVDWDDLLVKMHHNLNTYWAGFTTNPRRMRWLLADDGIQWAVLGVLRQFYTFREHDITSKIEAGEYGLQHVPAPWQRLIQEAINIRQQVQPSLFRSRVVRAVLTRAFLQLIITACASKTEHGHTPNETRSAKVWNSSGALDEQRETTGLSFAGSSLKR